MYLCMYIYIYIYIYIIMHNNNYVRIDLKMGTFI